LNRKRWTIVAAAVVVVLLGAWWWRSRSASATPKYRTAEVERGSIQSVVSATGTIRPMVQVEVGSQVSGTVERIFADYNSRVRAGQVILQLEQSSFRARVVQAEAAVARAQASVKDAERALARAQELFDRKYLSQAELDAALVALEVRKADLKEAIAQREVAQVDLEHTTIRAPIDGVVISRSIDLGQTVAASLQAPKLFVIANNLAEMQVETRIDEADIGQIRQDLPVTFTVDAFPDREFEGRVTQVRLEPIDDQNVVTYTTVIRTSNPDGRLRPGMTANVTVQIERRDGVLRVPNAALRFRPAPKEGGSGRKLAAGGSAGDASRRAPREGARGAGEAQAATDPGTRGGWQRGPGGLSDEQRAAWRARMKSASPDERVRLRDSMTTVMRPGSPGGGDSGTDTRGRDLVRRRAAGGGPRLNPMVEPGSGAGADAPTYRPGTVYVLRAGRPERVGLLTGITDGAFTEVRTDQIQSGDLVVVGMEASARASANLQPPPGMGGPTFRGPGGRR